MTDVILLASNWTDMWYAFPLIVAISLVYAGTRHENLHKILHRALRVGTWITGFMVVAFLVLLLISWSL